MENDAFDIIHKVNVRGLNLAYRVWPSFCFEKTKGVVFLLHGFLDHSGTWREIIKFLPNNYIYVAFDCRGHGDSDWMPTCFSAYHDFDFIIDTVYFIKEIKSEIQSVFVNPNSEFAKNAALKYFGDKDFYDNTFYIKQKHFFLSLPNYIVGHSFGGLLGLTIIGIKKFEHISGLVSIESTLIRGYSEKIFSLMYEKSYDWIIKTNLSHLNEKKIFKTEEEAIERLVRTHISKNPNVARKLAKENIKKIGESYTFKLDPRLSFKFAGNAGPRSLYSRLNANIDVPVLIIACTKGVFGEKSWPEQIAFIKKNPSSQFFDMKMIEGGHHVHMEPQYMDGLLEELRQTFQKWELLFLKGKKRRLVFFEDFDYERVESKL